MAKPDPVQVRLCGIRNLRQGAYGNITYRLPPRTVKLAFFTDHEHGGVQLSEDSAAEVVRPAGIVIPVRFCCSGTERPVQLDEQECPCSQKRQDDENMFQYHFHLPFFIGKGINRFDCLVKNNME